MSKTLTKSEAREALTQIWDALTTGETESDIMDLLGVDGETYAKLKDMLLDKKTEELRTRPVEHIYAEYVINQIQNVGACTDILVAAKKDESHAAAVAAVRARAAIYDNMLTKGQELGLFKPVGGKQNAGPIIAVDMTNTEIKVELAKAIREVVAMMRKFGDGDITSIPTGPIHYGEAIDATPRADAIVVAPKSKGDRSSTAKAKSSKASKRSRGRKSFSVSGS